MRKLTFETARLAQKLSHLMRRRTGFFQTLLGNISAQLKTIDKIAESDEPAAVIPLAELLLEKQQLAERATSGICNLLRGYASLDYLSLEHEIREYYRWTFDSKWNSLRHGSRLVFHGNDEARASAWGVLSIHPNGCIRQTAVEHLEKIFADQSLPFLLLRLNDWVPEVRDAAMAAVMRRIRLERSAGFLNNLPLVLRLSGCGRWNHATVVHQIFRFLLKHHERELIDVVINRCCRSVRRAGYKQLNSQAGPHCEHMVRSALAADDYILRLWAIHDAAGFLPRADLRMAFLAGLHDRFPAVRREAIEGIGNYLTTESNELIQDSLLDRSRAVREGARYVLRKQGWHDFAGYYRNAIVAEKHLAAAIAGIGETGKSQDVDLVLRFVESPLVNVRFAAVCAIGAIAPEDNKTVFFDCLKDMSRKVCRKAQTVLEGICLSSDVDLLRDIVASNPSPHVHSSAVAVIASLNSWETVPDLLRIAAADQPRSAEIALHSLRKRINCVWTSPPDDVKKAIYSALIDCSSRLGEEFVSGFSIWLKHRT